MEQIDWIKEDGLRLRWIIKEQSEDLCLAAVRQNGNALAFVQEQNKELCEEAIKKSPEALKHVKEEFLEEVLYLLRIRALFDPEIRRILKENQRMRERRERYQNMQK